MKQQAIGRMLAIEEGDTVVTGERRRVATGDVHLSLLKFGPEVASSHSTDATKTIIFCWLGTDSRSRANLTTKVLSGNKCENYSQFCRIQLPPTSCPELCQHPEPRHSIISGDGGMAAALTTVGLGAT